MNALEPIYTPENCRFAYQLNWGYSLFWRQPQTDDGWLEELNTATEPDGIRILKHRFETNTTSQFLLSTQPHVPPITMVARVKGRLQHLLKNAFPKAFQRNYALRSLGSTKRDVLDEYVKSQLAHDPPADELVRNRFERFQIHNPQCNLDAPRTTSHARYWYNLHVVLVNAGRWREIRNEAVEAIQTIILKVCRAKGYLLSRGGVLPDHVHLTLGCNLEESPQKVALSFMNNLAFASDMRPVLQFGAFIGTFGEYDLGAIR